METCKVEFINQTGQKIILEFTLQDDGNLDYKPSFEPKLIDPKTNLGLAGQFCEMFLTTLLKDNNVEDIQRKDNERNKRLES